MSGYIKDLQKHTGLLAQINEEIRLNKRAFVASDRTTVRALRNTCNRAIRDGKRLLMSDKMTDQVGGGERGSNERGGEGVWVWSCN